MLFEDGALAAVASTIGGLPALGRAEARPAPGHVRAVQDEVTTPTARVDVVRALSSRHVPVSGAVLHGGRYRNALATLSGHHPLAVSPGSGAGVSPAGRERSERGRAAALTPARSARYSTAWGGDHGGRRLHRRVAWINRRLGSPPRIEGWGMSVFLERWP